MLKVECFSKEKCRQLLDSGYTHFVIRDRGDATNTARRSYIIFEAVREKIDRKAIPIPEIMDLPAESMTSYYVTYVNEHLHKQA